MSVAEQRQHVLKRHTAKRRRRVAPKELHILHILSEYKSVLKLLKSLRDEIDEWWIEEVAAATSKKHFWQNDLFNFCSRFKTSHW